MSILDPLTCAFAKVVAFEYLTRNLIKNQNVGPTKNAMISSLKEIYDELQFFFGSDYFKINYTTFRNNYPFIVNQIRSIGKRNPDVKEHVLKTFSKSKWSLLSEELKSRHSPENCKGCLKKKIYKSVLAQFPIKSCVCEKKQGRQVYLKKKIFMKLPKKL